MQDNLIKQLNSHSHKNKHYLNSNNITFILQDLQSRMTEFFQHSSNCNLIKLKTVPVRATKQNSKVSPKCCFEEVLLKASLQPIFFAFKLCLYAFLVLFIWNIPLSFHNRYLKTHYEFHYSCVRVAWNEHHGIDLIIS